MTGIAALNSQGIELSNNGDIDGAIKLFAAAKREDPFDAQTRNNLGVALLRKGMNTDSLPYVKRARKNFLSARELGYNDEAVEENLRAANDFLARHGDSNDLSSTKERNRAGEGAEKRRDVKKRRKEKRKKMSLRDMVRKGALRQASDILSLRVSDAVAE